MKNKLNKITLATLCLGLAFFISCSDLPDINEQETTSSSSGKGASNPSSAGSKSSSSSAAQSSSSAALYSSSVVQAGSSSSNSSSSVATPSSNSTPSSSSVAVSSSSVVQSSSGGSPVTKEGIWSGKADISWYNATRETFRISKAEELAGLAQLVNDGTTDFYGKTITLNADIMLNDTTGWKDKWEYYEADNTWTPIGKDKTHSFRGTFDGDGHIVSGVYYYDGTNGRTIGLFGYINGGVIKKLGVVASYIYGLSGVGCLLGEAYNGSISSSYSKCIVKTKSGSGSDVGGLVGFSVGITISDCYSTSTVYGNSRVGGLAGCACGEDNVVYNLVNPSKISNSYSIGEVSGTSYVGGLVGMYMYKWDSGGVSTITNSYYDQTTSKQTDAIGKSVGKTTADMQTTEFASTLGTEFKYNAGGYPKLKWEK